MKDFIKELKDEQDYIFFYSSFPTDENPQILLFSKPVTMIECWKKTDIQKQLNRIDSFITQGYYIAGYISYETGLFFNDLPIDYDKKIPLFSFGVYEKPLVIKKPKIKPWKSYVIFDIKRNISFNQYKSGIQRIKKFLEDGEVYQINYCFKEKFRFYGDSFDLFLNLVDKQKTQYSAFVKNKDYCILSISPEMFFSVKNNKIIMKPMKGTLLRERNENLSKLKDDKNKAENIMIVDLIRNDMGKICKTNSIKVPQKFTIEKYETLYQMTSTITGELKEKIKFSDIMISLFPSGSVTGAPKRRAMQIIKLLEKEPRGIYTGSIGYFSKERAMFNICIRTPVINTATEMGEIGIGSGIVYDSIAKNEYEECLGKAKFFEMLSINFKIFESILYQKGKGFFLVDEHLYRMEIACRYFNFKFNWLKAWQELLKFSKKIKDTDKYKIRIFVDINGKFTIDCKKLKTPKNIYKLVVSNERTDSNNIFLRYKTTNREFYDIKLAEAKKKGYDEVVFFNEKGELTECATSNIFILKNGILYTPPLYCGLLGGTLRHILLMKKSEKYREKVLYEKDLTSADGIYICNSVIGLRRAILK